MRKFKTSLLEYAESNNLPHLLEEYDSSNPLPPSEIGCNSTIAVQWTCAHGHTEIESVQKRIRRGYCSVCGQKGAGSFAQKHPEMLEYWSQDNHVSPYEIPPNYSKNIIWICPKGHSWERKIPLQLKLKSCPICKSSLFLQAPELLKEWDAKANKNIDKNTVYAYSNTVYFWRCKHGHSYTATPAQLMRRSTKCPICASFGHQFPEAAAEWHPTKNGDKTPYDFTTSSQKDAWFICSKCGQEYISRIAHRAHRKGDSCPNCTKK